MKIPSKNPFLLLVFIIFGTTSLVAQDQNIRDKELSVKLHHLMDLYQYNEACHVADQLLETDSLNIEVLILKGRALAADFKTHQAKDCFRKAYLLDTTQTKSLFELVNVYKQLGNSKQAISYCQKLVDLNPESSFFRIQLSNLYYGTEDFRLAKDILLPLYRKDSVNAYVLKQLGNCDNEMQQVDSAMAFYIKYLDIIQYDALITGKLANLFIKKRDYTSGLCLTEIYLNYDSTNTGILKLNAYFHYLLKDYQAAAQKFSKCVLLGDSSEFTYKYYGLSYYRQERYDLAEPQLRLAYLADTTDAEDCFYYGVSACRSALMDTGIFYLEKTMKLLMPDPQFLNTLQGELAEAYNSNGQTDTALALLKSAYETYPDNATLAFKIAYQYDYYLRKPILALPFYIEFLEKCPESEKIELNIPQRRSYYEYTVNRVKEIKGK